MTFSEELRRAVERLRCHACVNIIVPDVYIDALEIPLAALIEAVSNPDGVWCPCCGARIYPPITEHAPDCALAAIVHAINGTAIP